MCPRRSGATGASPRGAWQLPLGELAVGRFHGRCHHGSVIGAGACMRLCFRLDVVVVRHVYLYVHLLLPEVLLFLVLAQRLHLCVPGVRGAKSLRAGLVWSQRVDVLLEAQRAVVVLHVLVAQSPVVRSKLLSLVQAALPVAPPPNVPMYLPPAGELAAARHAPPPVPRAVCVGGEVVVGAVVPENALQPERLDGRLVGLLRLLNLSASGRPDPRLRQGQVRLLPPDGEHARVLVGLALARGLALAPFPESLQLAAGGRRMRLRTSPPPFVTRRGPQSGLAPGGLRRGRPRCGGGGLLIRSAAGGPGRLPLAGGLRRRRRSLW
mmetsp:Transcript_104982/g.334236  ORF Transcript_104982/g.334236 Transcript_104982/m.334236 type:complete len:323 (-) Transcript_104982:463-1431(-)